VVYTLVEAMALVFAVMFLFLQNIRYTLIPTMVVPVALMGTFATMLALGFSINVLTMFGMVLAIGILVDDAIVVVENVERIMARRPVAQEATRKAMGQITGAIIGITLVLVAVFCRWRSWRLGGGDLPPVLAVDGGVDPVLGVPGPDLTPALCATLLKPMPRRAPRQGWLLRLVQPPLRATDRAL
jgi:multidrug efflux pump